MAEAKGRFRLFRGFVEKTFSGDEGVIVVQPECNYKKFEDLIPRAKELGNCWVEKDGDVAHLSRGTRIKLK